MYYKCCVRGCSSTRNDAILHRFPKNENRIYLWLRCLNDDELQTSSLHNLFVCGKHFEKRFIGMHSRLRSNAHPTLFSQDELSTGIPHNSNDTGNGNTLLDHSYSRKRHLDHNYCKEDFSSANPVNLNTEVQPSTSFISENAENLKPEDQPSTSTTSNVFISPSASSIKGAVSTRLIPTGKTMARKRLVKSLQQLSPVAKRIYREYRKSQDQVSYHLRAKRALKFSKDKAFVKLTNDMNPFAKKFLAMQINLYKKKKKGRRFSLDEKLIALAIMKQSPKCYRFLQKIFILPSATTLNKMISHLNIEAGMNPKLFKIIKKEVSTWKDNKKYCTVFFDEMSLGMGLSYDQKKDKVHGFVDLEERKPRFADHVLVFMIRGAVFKWQQPIAYFFCEGATPWTAMKQIIRKVVVAVAETGLKPVALACDQGTSFQSAIKSFQEDTKRVQLLNGVQPDDTIIIEDIHLNIIFDPCHLIKGIRNNFLTKNIESEGKISKWQDIVDVYKTDCNHTQSRLLHGLNDEHVIPEKIKKMKVKNCVKVLSNTTAAALLYTSEFSHYVDGTPVSNTMKNTYETVKFFDNLFDSINGSSASIQKCKGKPLKVAVHKTSPHVEFWKSAIEKLNNMKFIDESGRGKTVPTLKNFITTLKSFVKLWQFFETIQLKIMRPRYFNTDPIENFFGQVRAYNFRNNDPTCHNFMNTYKSLIITRVMKFHSESFNCEDDPAEQLLNLHKLFENENNEIISSPLGHSSREYDVTNNVEQARRERLNVHSRAYTAGWVIKKIIDKTKCVNCKNSLTGAADPSIHKWISHREYKESKKKEKLLYPSEEVVRLFGAILKETNEYLEHNAHRNDIKETINSIVLSKYSFDLVECEHQALVSTYFVDIIIRFTINNWCNIINKILRGVDIFRLRNKVLPHYQALALEKYKKKLRNKSFNK